MRTFLDFEQPIAELEAKVDELRHMSDDGSLNIADEVQRLQAKADKLLLATYGKLSAWQKVQVARHPERPHGLAYVERLITDWAPLAGDRCFGDDEALLAGLGRFQGLPVAVLAHEKGHDMATRVRHNFGMAKPEGYRKATRVMDLAARFDLPLLTFVDTAGAYPGVEAEARGQAGAIARAIDVTLAMPTPVIATVIGEGGSGGAIAIAAGNAVIMLEHSVYSVISPEGCASILWRSGENTQEAAEALRLTAQDLLKLGLVDQIVPEPLGGAHRAPEIAIDAVGQAIAQSLSGMRALDGAALRGARRQKFLEMGKRGL